MGKRRPQFYFLAKPNWQTPVKIRRAFRTTVKESLTGDEHRSSLLANPIRTESWHVECVEAKESAYLLRVMHKHQNKLIGIPLWPEHAQLTAEAAADQNELTVNSTTYKEFEAGQEVVILGSDWDTFEIATIHSMTSTVITLLDNLSSTWPIYSEVYPIIPARFQETLSGIVQSDQFLSGHFELKESWEATSTTTTSSSSSTTSSTASTTSSVSTTSSSSSTVSTTSSTSSSSSTTSSSTSSTTTTTA